MWVHSKLTSIDRKKFIAQGKIQFGGNVWLKIYGTLSCASGKRMKKQNRVFFKNEMEATRHGFRPCGHCLREKYLQWIEQESG